MPDRFFTRRLSWRRQAYSPRRWFDVCLVLATLWLAGCQPVMPPTPAAGDAAAEAPTTAIETGATVEPDAAHDLEATAAVTGATALTATTGVTATASLSSPVAADPALVEAGLAVYRQQYCGVCHVLTAAGTRGTFGPPHDGMGATAAQRIQDDNYSGHATTAAGYILESLLDPQVYYVEGYAATPHRMPPYGHLDPSALDALVAFLLVQ